METTIARIAATALRVESDFSEFGVDRRRTTSICLVEVETTGGLKGHGLTYLADGSSVAQIVNAVAAPAVMGLDALDHERAWHVLYWTLTASAQTGFACHAISAIDLALWDIKGKATGQPIFRLLGGARDRLTVYATLGIPRLDREELVEVARRVVSRGFRSIKIQVGRPGLDQRSGPSSLDSMLKEDVARIAALRDALGEDVEIAIDGSCRFDLPHAARLARQAMALGVTWYEEPIMQNDVRLMAELRRQTGISVTAGQNEGQLHRFRDMLVHEAADMIQPNVSVAGGITQCTRVAALATAFNVPIASGGGGVPYHNMHLQAGLAVGTKLEYQTSSAKACSAIITGYPEIVDGIIVLPNKPGLGFEPDHDAVREFAA